MKQIIDFISNICPITSNSIIDSIIFAVIGGIAFCIAWNLTSAAADSSYSHDSNCMSSFHWIIRILIFFLLLGIVLAVVNFIHWFGSWPWWGYLIFGIGVSGAISIIVHITR